MGRAVRALPYTRPARIPSWIWAPLPCLRPPWVWGALQGLRLFSRVRGPVPVLVCSSGSGAPDPGPGLSPSVRDPIPALRLLIGV